MPSASTAQVGRGGKEETCVPFGEYPYTIDDKGRVVMPPAFREFVEDGMILTRGMEGCLYVFPLASWKRVEEQLEGLPLTDAESRAFVRFFYSGANKARLDNQSRVSVPQTLRGFAALESEVIVAGAPGRLELWSPPRWDAAIGAVQNNPPKPDLLANFVA
nr:division/cell wall cluster transcriptional repressor MraZ [Deinococcus arboris]